MQREIGWTYDKIDARVIGAPKDIVIHDNEIARDGIAFVEDELVDALHVVDSDGQSGETAGYGRKEPEDQEDLRESDRSPRPLHWTPSLISIPFPLSSPSFRGDFSFDPVLPAVGFGKPSIELVRRFIHRICVCSSVFVN